MDINKEMEEIIRKNLPEATATTLKKYIEEAEEKKRRLAACDLVIEQNNNIINILNKQIATLTGQVKLENELISREKTVSGKENKLEVVLANLKTAEAEKRADAIYNLAGIVFKNPSFTRSISRNGGGTKSNTGGYENNSHNENETVVEGVA